MIDENSIQFYANTIDYGAIFDKDLGIRAAGSWRIITYTNFDCKDINNIDKKHIDEVIALQKIISGTIIQKANGSTHYEELKIEKSNNLNLITSIPYIPFDENDPLLQRILAPVRSIFPKSNSELGTSSKITLDF